MAYEFITKYTAKNYTPAAQVPGVFGYPPTKKWITIHHWGAMESGYRPARFYEIAGYLASANSRMVSAHYVVERGKIACLINPADASWANGNAQGNAQSISIECNPLASPEDKATLAELVAELRATYGELVIVPHAYWTPTECPGLYNVFEIDAMALEIERNRGKGAVAPAANDKQKLEWSDMATEKEIRDVIRDELRRFVGDVVDVPGNQPTGKGNDQWTIPNAITSIWGDVGAIRENLTPDAIAKAVLTHPVELQGIHEGTTDLATKAGWEAHELQRIRQAVETLAGRLNKLTQCGNTESDETGAP